VNTQSAAGHRDADVLRAALDRYQHPHADNASTHTQSYPQAYTQAEVSTHHPSPPTQANTRSSNMHTANTHTGPAGTPMNQGGNMLAYLKSKGFPDDVCAMAMEIAGGEYDYGLALDICRNLMLDYKAAPAPAPAPAPTLAPATQVHAHVYSTASAPPMLAPAPAHNTQSSYSQPVYQQQERRPRDTISELQSTAEDVLLAVYEASAVCARTVQPPTDGHHAHTQTWTTLYVALAYALNMDVSPTQIQFYRHQLYQVLQSDPKFIQMLQADENTDINDELVQQKVPVFERIGALAKYIKCELCVFFRDNKGKQQLHSGDDKNRGSGGPPVSYNFFGESKKQPKKSRVYLYLLLEQESFLLLVKNTDVQTNSSSGNSSSSGGSAREDGICDDDMTVFPSDNEQIFDDMLAFADTMTF
jgi:hypothetical protein